MGLCGICTWEVMGRCSLEPLNKPLGQKAEKSNKCRDEDKGKEFRDLFDSVFLLITR